MEARSEAEGSKSKTKRDDPHHLSRHRSPATSSSRSQQLIHLHPLPPREQNQHQRPKSHSARAQWRRASLCPQLQRKTAALICEARSLLMDSKTSPPSLEANGASSWSEKDGRARLSLLLSRHARSSPSLWEERSDGRIFCDFIISVSFVWLGKESGFHFFI